MTNEQFNEQAETLLEEIIKIDAEALDAIERIEVSAYE